MGTPLREKDAVGLPELRLKIRVHGRHPWFYRKMITKPGTPLRPGSAVRVVDRDGTFVGTGFYNPRTELALRMLAREDVADVEGRLLELLARAVALREDVLQLPEVTNGYRLVHGEGDGFPGLVLDRLGGAVVAQVRSLAMAERMEAIGRWLKRHAPDLRLILTIDEDSGRHEGMERPPRAAPFATEVVEHGLTYQVEPGTGHKTGFFADQRDNRRWFQGLAKGRRVLDLFCNAGGFAMAAARGGARSVLAVDLDEAAVLQTETNARRNKLKLRVEQADAFDVLRAQREGEHDAIVVDPPKWAMGRDGVEAALPRYRDINRLAFEKVSRGGIVVTCSCSGALPESLFLKVLAEAAAEAGRDATLLKVTGAGPDHPIALECPETRYLKVAFVLVRGTASAIQPRRPAPISDAVSRTRDR